MNRLQGVIEKLRSNPGLLAIPRSAITIDLEEFSFFQDQQALAFASSGFNLVEAKLVHDSLGDTFSEENDGWAPGTDRATKVTVLRLMLELNRTVRST